MTNHREFTRKELYELVWSTAMVKLAKQFGMSDVGLRKICVKHDIPTPPLGYWAKLNFGKPVTQTPLGPPGKGVSDQVYVSVYAIADMPDEVLAAEIEGSKLHSEPIEVPSELPEKLHPVAKATLRSLKSAKPDQEGFIHVGGTGLVTAVVGRENVTRTAILLDTFFKAIVSKGYEINDSKDNLDIVVGGEKLRLTIGETKSKVAHQPTKTELKSHADWEALRVKYPGSYNYDRRHWRAWDYVPSGRLTATLTDPRVSHWQSGHLLGRWYDRKSAQLETYLGAMLIALHSGGALVRHNRLADEERVRLEKEAADARERERQRQRRIVQLDKFIGTKADELITLQKIQTFRAHLNEALPLDDGTDFKELIDATDDLIDRLEYTVSAEGLCSDIPAIETEPHWYRYRNGTED